MSQSDAASQAAVERLRKEIENDKKRLSFAMQSAEDDGPSQKSRVGRLYKVFEAMGQAP